MSQELGLGLLRGTPLGSRSQTGRSAARRDKAEVLHRLLVWGPGVVGRGTYHNLVAFDQ